MPEYLHFGKSARLKNSGSFLMPQIFSRCVCLHKSNSQLYMDFKRIIAEGNLVAFHNHLKPNPQDRGVAVVDIFRVEDGKLVEHWDVIQPVPTNRQTKMDVLNVTFHANDWFAHNISDCISHLEWFAHKQKFGFAFTLRVNS